MATQNGTIDTDVAHSCPHHDSEAPTGASKPSPDWDFGSIRIERLRNRSSFYAKQAGASQDLIDTLDACLGSPLVQELLSFSEQELNSVLVNDVYKPKMHKVYSDLYTTVEATFCLNIRKTPMSLDRIHKEDLPLFRQYEELVHDLNRIVPVTKESNEVLETYSNCATTESMKGRAEKIPLPPVIVEQADRVDITTASGPVEAASNVETSMTQIVQQITVRAQVRDLFRRTGVRLDRTERLANSLGHLAGVLQQLSALEGSQTKLALFAGRRSSDRAYLLLQNLLCAGHLPHYMGTSSVYAVTLISRALRHLGITDPQQRILYTGRLVGTHAHELMMITARLLARYDNAAGSAAAPVPVSALLAHLLFLRANGGVPSATALADTFGTAAFVETALVSEVPAEFLEDMADRHSEEPPLPHGCMVFDLFRTWRLDSGSYEDIAGVVISAWERRRAAGSPMPRPALMHSNLRSAEEVLQVCRLPERIRPAVCAFGGLTDGFMPFHLPGGDAFHLELASVVMKAVQARIPGESAADEALMPCAGKLGDDANMVKAQVDPRLPSAEQEKVKARMAALFRCRDIVPGRATSALASAYHDVTRRRVLCQRPG